MPPSLHIKFNFLSINNLAYKIRFDRGLVAPVISKKTKLLKN